MAKKKVHRTGSVYPKTPDQLLAYFRDVERRPLSNQREMVYYIEVVDLVKGMIIRRGYDWDELLEHLGCGPLPSPRNFTAMYALLTLPPTGYEPYKFASNPCGG